MLKTYKPLRSKQGLKRGKGLDRSAPKVKTEAQIERGKRRDLNRARRGLSVSEPHVQAARAWCKSIGFCQRCGIARFGKNLECHHILTVGAYPELKACPWNLLCLCRACHRWAHDFLGEFRQWLESLKPGLLAHLYAIAREWVRKPADEVLAIYATIAPRREWWDAMEVA